VEQLDRGGDGIELVDGEEPGGERVADHLPAVEDRRGPGRDHDDQVDEVLRVAVEHVDRSREQAEPECERRDDHESQHASGELGGIRSPAGDDRTDEQDDELREEMHRGHVDRGHRKQLARKVDLPDERRVPHDRPRGVAEPLAEEVDDHDP